MIYIVDQQLNEKVIKHYAPKIEMEINELLSKGQEGNCY